MITRLLDAARARVQMADAVAKTDETLTIRLREGEIVAAHTSEHAGHSLRVVVEGRIGVAGTTALDPDALLEAALASAAAGDEAPLLLPGPSPLPRVHTHVPRAASATVAELGQMGHVLTNRLRQGGRSVTIHMERSVGSVQVGNTRGVDTEYQVTLVTLDIDVLTPSGDGSVHVMAHLAGADLPDQAAIDAVVADFEQRPRRRRPRPQLRPRCCSSLRRCGRFWYQCSRPWWGSHSCSARHHSPRALVIRCCTRAFSSRTTRCAMARLVLVRSTMKACRASALPSSRVASSAGASMIWRPVPWRGALPQVMAAGPPSARLSPRSPISCFTRADRTSAPSWPPWAMGSSSMRWLGGRAEVHDPARSPIR